MRNPPRPAATIAALAAACLAGCASLETTHTGFLPVYPPAAGGQAYRSRSLLLPGSPAATAPGRFYVEPVGYQPVPGTPYLLPAEIEALEAGYRDDLRRVFGRQIAEAGSQGPGIAVIRATITGVAKANPLLNGVTMAVALVPVTAGGATSEAEVVDGTSGEPVAVLQGVANGGRDFLGGPVGYLSSLGQARRALARQARELGCLALPSGTLRTSSPSTTAGHR
jgi:hypothetical protein